MLIDTQAEQPVLNSQVFPDAALRALLLLLLFPRCCPDAYLLYGLEKPINDVCALLHRSFSDPLPSSFLAATQRYYELLEGKTRKENDKYFCALRRAITFLGIHLPPFGFSMHRITGVGYEIIPVALEYQQLKEVIQV